MFSIHESRGGWVCMCVGGLSSKESSCLSWCWSNKHGLCDLTCPCRSVGFTWTVRNRKKPHNLRKWISGFLKIGCFPWLHIPREQDSGMQEVGFMSSAYSQQYWSNKSILIITTCTWGTYISKWQVEFAVIAKRTILPQDIYSNWGYMVTLPPHEWRCICFICLESTGIFVLLGINQIYRTGRKKQLPQYTNATACQGVGVGGGTPCGADTKLCVWRSRVCQPGLAVAVRHREAPPPGNA